MRARLLAYDWETATLPRSDLRSPNASGIQFRSLNLDELFCANMLFRVMFYT